MEPAGLTIGIVGLAGLFSSCTDCFELVQRGRYFGDDFLILETKYNNQRLRLSAWGRACGIAPGHHDDDHSRTTWSDEVVSAIEETLNQISHLFQNHTKLSQHYGLRLVDANVVLEPLGATALGGLVPKLKTTNLVKWMRPDVAREKTKSVRSPATARWAIEGRTKFSELVQHLRDFIDDLESLTAELNDDVRKHQRRYIQEDVGSITEITDLEAIEKARMSERDAVADAASIRLCWIQESAIPQLQQDQAQEPEWVNIQQPTMGECEDPLMKYHQTIHRVSCSICPTRSFLDEPSYMLSNEINDQWMITGDKDSSQTPRSLHLCGKRPISNPEVFLSENPQLWWIEIKDYTCSHDVHSLRRASVQKEVIKLLSTVLAENLNMRLYRDVNAWATLATGIELSPPHAWYYHHRNSSLLDPLFGAPSIPLSEFPAFARGCLKENEAVEWDLVDHIKRLTAKEYRQLERALKTGKNMKWEHLPLVFCDGITVVEKCPQDDDYRAFKQIGLSRLVRDKDGVEHIEIICSRPLEDCCSVERCTLRILRPLVENGQSQGLDLQQLSILPIQHQENCSLGYLENRGEKLLHLTRRGTVEYQEHQIDHTTTGLYYLDPAVYRRLDLSDQKPSGMTCRLEDLVDDYESDYSYDDTDFPRCAACNSTSLEGFEELTENEDYDDHFSLRCKSCGYGNPDVLDDDYDVHYENDNRGSMLMRYNKHCMPHAIYGFHLTEHVWKRLLVRNMCDPSLPSKAVINRVLGTVQCVELINLFKRHNANGRNKCQSASENKFIVGFTSSGRAEAARVISRIVERPLYHFALSQDNSQNLKIGLEKMRKLATRWGCIVYFDDILPVLLGKSSSPSLEAVGVRSSFIDFLDSFQGPIILSLDHTKVQSDGKPLDEDIEGRIDQRFDFPVVISGPWTLKPEDEDLNSKTSGS